MAGVVIPAAVLDAVMAQSFPAMCDGVSFLCWLIDERGRVLHARDISCASPAPSCVGQRFAAVRPRVASSLVSAGVFQIGTVKGTSAEIPFMYLQRSFSSKTVTIAASHDSTHAAAEQQLEVTVFAVKDTSAMAAVLSAKGMQVTVDVDSVASVVQLHSFPFIPRACSL